MSASRQWTPLLGRDVTLRPGTSDRQVWADTFTGLYHVPPDDMPAPRTVLDLGANVGLVAAHYHALWPEARIVGLELDEACVELARENAGRVVLGGGAPVTFQHRAVSAAGGLGSYDPSGRAEAFAFVPSAGDLPPGHVCVESVTLDRLVVECFGTAGVDFVKMDVEGEEWQLFANGRPWAHLVRHLLVELHGDYPSEYLVTSAVGWLTRLGFQARHHEAHPQAVYAWR